LLTECQFERIFMKSLKILFFIFLILSLAYPKDYWQNYVHYKIDVTLDDSRHFLYGNQEITYFNNSPDTLRTIHLLIYPNAYKNNDTHLARQKKLYKDEKLLNAPDDLRGFIHINSFQVDSDSAKLIIPKDSLSTAYFYPKKPVPPGDSLKINLQWQVKIPTPFSRLCHKDQKYFITQWYPKLPVYDKQGWHPYPYLEIGEFYYEFGDYEVNITLPENYVVAATGELIAPAQEFRFLDSLALIGEQVMKMSEEEYSGWQINNNTISSTRTKTLTFRAKNVVDFAWTASKEHLIQKRDFAYSGSNQNIELWNYFLPENRKSWRYALDISEATLQSYGELCGPYPYPKVVSVDGNQTAGGGMEYPMLTIINSMDIQALMWQVIAHEIGHNWFYGILGFNERKEAWMDEGLNTFGEMRFMETQFPDSLAPLNSLPFSKFFKMLVNNYDSHGVYQTYMAKAAYDGDIKAADLDGYFYTSGNSYNVSVYVKPAMGFRLLESYVGREKFYEAMNQFYEDWKFRHPQPEDLQNSLENSLGVDLNWLFTDYLTTTKLPDYEITAFDSHIIQDKYITTVEVKNSGKASQPFPVAIYKNGKELKKIWSAGKQEHEVFTFETSEKPDKSVISPNLETIENSYYNNFSTLLPPLDFNFLFNIPTVNRYMINIIPYANYNYNEGIKLGGGFYHLTPKITRNAYYFYGTYAPKNQYFNSNAQYYTMIKGAENNYSVKGQFSNDILKNYLGGVLKISNKNGPPHDNTVIHAGYKNIKSNDYLDQRFWSKGKFLNLQIDRKFMVNSINFDLRVKYNRDLKTAENFYKISGEMNKSTPLPTKHLGIFHLSNRLFAGTLVGDKAQMPAHLRFFAGGGIDPDFEQFYTYDRSGNTCLSPHYNYYLPDGVNLKGYQHHVDRKGKAGSDHLAFGYNLEIRRGIIFGFFDAGSLISEDEEAEILWDAGLGVKLFLLKFHLPIYVNKAYDGYDNFTHGQSWKKRWMVSIDLSGLPVFKQ